jgi:protein phosphatase 2C family protein 2/3
MQGWRISMEDSHAAVLDLQSSDEPQRPTTAEERLSFFGVYDGHGGDKVAIFSGENIHKILTRQAAFAAKDYEQALKDAFLATDRAILQGTAVTGGAGGSGGPGRGVDVKNLV